jgi:L-ascorbate metabolism protein UlaG (beta-lactamase superfamily)
MARASSIPTDRPRRPAASGGVTWLGHSTVLLELDGIRILTDPVVLSRVGPLLRVAPPVAPESLRDVDVVLLSHMHADHVHLGSLRAVGAGTAVLAPNGAGDWLRRHGLRDVRELGQETAEIGPLSIAATPAVHDGRRHRLAPASESIGFAIRGSRSVYFAGDTDLYPEMGDLGDGFDVALLPVAGWGPKVGPGHLDPVRAAEAARRIKPRLAVPIHWGTLALPWAARRPPADPSPAAAFAQLVAEVAPGTEVRVLAPGESMAFA